MFAGRHCKQAVTHGINTFPGDETINRATLIQRVAGAGIALCTAAVIAIGPAFAASGGGSSGGSSGGSGSNEVQCNAGWVYDKKKQICVRKDAASDRDLYEQGRALALAGDYEGALDLLQSVRDQNNSMVLTMIGYSKRKMGQFDEGFAYYHKALDIEPDNVLTREYLGEGYVMIGRIDLAQAELDRIGVICGTTTCEEYQDLAAAIEGKPEW